MGLKDYFSFNKRQRNGIIVLLTLILGMMIYLVISDYLPPENASEDFTSFKAEMARVKFRQADTVRHSSTTDISSNNSALTAPIDINNADSADFMSFPLITPKIARTIIRFREALGGYCSKKQLLEVYGMDTACYYSILDKITLDSSRVEKININTATEKDLAHHPYIHKKLAKVIVDYRKEHGLFKQINDILKIEGIDKDLYAKLYPYLTITD
ncbi:MAG: ComEA family DNA-binding protein [Bacteroidia bacterium]